MPQRRVQTGQSVPGVPRSWMGRLLLTASLACAAAASVPAVAGARKPSPQPPPAAPLTLDVFTGSEKAFNVTSTLIAGRKEAILVDTQFLASDAATLAERIAARGVTLKAIVVTHPHPDHYFGAAVLHAKFPDAPIYMTPATRAEVLRTQAAKIAFWKPILGANEVPAAIPEAQLLPDEGLVVEGEKVEVVTDLQGDVLARTNSFVWVPALRAAIAGDLVFDRMHVWLAESTPQTRRAWQSSLRRLAALAPRRVVAGHKQSASLPDAPEAVAATAAYISRFETARAAAADAPALIAAMRDGAKTGADADLGFPNILELSAQAAYAPRP